ncbi:MAG: hypothetical protein IJZ68_05610 [Bacteroidaceae bacterium]|nr:hypothetical protein [Bacteroidaceae bacterium]
MTEKQLLIFTAIFLFIWLVDLIHTYCELRRPDYLKPKNFFRMYDSGDGLLRLAAEEGIQVKHQYITNMWMETQDVVSEKDMEHNIQEVSK